MIITNDSRLPLLSASVSCMDLGRLEQQIKEVEDSTISFFHYDVVDGYFNNCFIFGDVTLRYLRRHSALPIELHLAVRDPDFYIQRMGPLGADYIAVHYEVLKDPDQTFGLIRQYGAKPVLAFRQETPPSEDFVQLAGQCAWILKLTVNPGYSGQQMNQSSLTHIARMRNLLDLSNLPIRIQADGNVNASTIRQLYQAGASTFTGGTSGLFLPGHSVRDQIAAMESQLNQPFIKYHIEEDTTC